MPNQKPRYGKKNAFLTAFFSPIVKEGLKPARNRKPLVRYVTIADISKDIVAEFVTTLIVSQPGLCSFWSIIFSYSMLLLVSWQRRLRTIYRLHKDTVYIVYTHTCTYTNLKVVLLATQEIVNFQWYSIATYVWTFPKNAGIMTITEAQSGSPSKACVVVETCIIVDTYKVEAPNSSK